MSSLGATCLLWAHSSHPRGGRPFPGISLSWGDSSALLLILVSPLVLVDVSPLVLVDVSPLVLVVSPLVLVVSPLHLLLVLALLVILLLVSSFSRSCGLSSSCLSYPFSSSFSLSSQPLPPSRVACLLLIILSLLLLVLPLLIVTSPLLSLAPPCCCRVALWIRPLSMSLLQALSFSGSPPWSSLPGPSVNRD